jgi:hypothetical protein
VYRVRRYNPFGVCLPRGSRVAGRFVFFFFFFFIRNPAKPEIPQNPKSRKFEIPLSWNPSKPEIPQNPKSRKTEIPQNRNPSNPNPSNPKSL